MCTDGRRIVCRTRHVARTADISERGADFGRYAMNLWTMSRIQIARESKVTEEQMARHKKLWDSKPLWYKAWSHFYWFPHRVFWFPLMRLARRFKDS